ncbi:MAG: phosphoglucomutase [Bacteroidetes bacterium HGW-Bacteroidetes-9]|jgi:phosphoglucomutase|nr:MAG: phosphoglucomutase [Bacteroidetes bacterium HGW-Bacteroidetes-9]
MKEVIKNKTAQWLSESFDQQSNPELQKWIENKKWKIIMKAFSADLSFGTGGLRAILGPGTANINHFTIGKATQALVNYLRLSFPEEKIKIAIAYDSRKNSLLFAQHAAKIISCNGHVAYLFPDRVPVGMLSYFIRNRQCKAGIMITASHNPKEYSGLKVFWNDGAEVTSPHDLGIAGEMKNIVHPEQIVLNEEECFCRIKYVPDEYENTYIRDMTSLNFISREKNKKLNIVYSPLHGNGWEFVPDALQNAGFKKVTIVKEQEKPDVDFATVDGYPNPERPEAFRLALKTARRINADVVFLTDPDCDRVGLAYKDQNKQFQILNGNQTAALLFDFILSKQSSFSGKDFIIKSVVTTDLIKAIADHHNIECRETLTGFKNIASILREEEVQPSGGQFMGAAEESMSFMLTDKVRDKEAVSAIVAIAEMAWSLKQRKETLGEYLHILYRKYGYYFESTLSINISHTGQVSLNQVIESLRTKPPLHLMQIPIHFIDDYKHKIRVHLNTGKIEVLDVFYADMLCFHIDNGKIFIRPSGTEPKIKCYIMLKENLYDDIETAELVCRKYVRMISLALRIMCFPKVL